jgi:hypothetical protein
MADATTATMGVLETLAVAGLMGMLGQGARAIVGLKSMIDQANREGVDSKDVFTAARLLVSLMIGFIAGLAAAFIIGLKQVSAATTSDFQVLLGLAAAGYAGTDAIEGFLQNYLTGKSAPSLSPKAEAASASGSPQSATTDALGARLETVSDQMDTLNAALVEAAARTASGVPGTSYPAWALERDVKLARKDYWPHIVAGSRDFNIPISVIAAIGSKESQWGLALRPVGPAGAGDWTPRDPSKWDRECPPTISAGAEASCRSTGIRTNLPGPATGAMHKPTFTMAASCSLKRSASSRVAGATLRPPSAMACRPTTGCRGPIRLMQTM